MKEQTIKLIIESAVIVLTTAICGFVALSWLDVKYNEFLRNDNITACRPPGDEGERMVAVLEREYHGGPLILRCSYHATLDYQP